MSFNLGKQPSAADLSELGYTFEPVDPSGAPIGATITVRGPQSHAVREFSERRYRTTQERAAMAKRRGKEPSPLTLAEVEAVLVEQAVAHTVAWHDFSDGERPLPFTEDAAREAYAKHPWLRDQVITEGQELGNFMKASSRSSSSTPQPSSVST